MLAITLCLLAFSATQVVAQLPNFTGDVKVDFPTNSNTGTNNLFKPNGLPYTSTTWDGQEGDDDVGLPRDFPLTDFSGWDVDSIRFLYDLGTDTLAIGVDCLVVCGDADGDGNSGSASAILAGNGGDDLPRMEGTESFVLALDFGTNGSNNPDGTFDIVLGYPSNQKPQASQPFPCESGATNYGTDCFGIYLYDNASGGFDAMSQPSSRFLYDTSTGVLPHPAMDHNPNPSVSSPDLEWSISQFSVLRTTKLGVPAIDGEWEFDFALFAGSFQDDGVGEDLFPNAGTGKVVYPCPNQDECGVCGGDNSSCADCAGTPNGNAVFDVCNVCAGDGSSCLDCAGTPNGNAVVDACNVCAGDGSSCLDCAGVAGGNARVDQCGVCAGNNDCFDCFGVPNGTSMEDNCGICDGDGSTCTPPAPCAEFPSDQEISHMRRHIEEWIVLKKHLENRLRVVHSHCSRMSHDHMHHHSSSSSSSSDLDIGHTFYGGIGKCEQQVAAIQTECEHLKMKIAEQWDVIKSKKMELADIIHKTWAKVNAGELRLCLHSSSLTAEHPLHLEKSVHVHYTSDSSSSSSSSSSSHHHGHGHSSSSSSHHGHGHGHGGHGNGHGNDGHYSVGGHHGHGHSSSSSSSHHGHGNGGHYQVGGHHDGGHSHGHSHGHYSVSASSSSSDHGHGHGHSSSGHIHGEHHYVNHDGSGSGSGHYAGHHGHHDGHSDSHNDGHHGDHNDGHHGDHNDGHY